MGVWTSWYPSGMMMRQEGYLSDRKGYDLGSIRHGKWIYYSPEEEMIKQEVYSYGKLISVELFSEGKIMEADDSIHIVIPDTTKPMFVSIETLASGNLKKQEVFRDEILLRKEVLADGVPFYYELFVRDESIDSTNLIPNPGFEEYKKLPESTGQLDLCANSWSSGGRTPSSYFSEYSGVNYVAVPVNNFGYENASDGKAYAGIGLGYLEFLSARLNDTLEENGLYCIKIKVSLAENSKEFTKKFGILFSSEKKRLTASSEEIPQVHFTNSEGFTEMDGWTELCGTYEATGSELYMTFGSFFTHPSAYYYVDEVEVTKIEDEAECGCVKEITFSDLNPDEIKINMEYRLSFVDFDENFNLTEGFNIELDNVFDMMDRNPGMRAEIGVYCSNVDGEEAANGTRKVAQTVAGYIQSRGIDASRISSKGYGQSDDGLFAEEGKIGRVVIKFLSL